MSERVTVQGKISRSATTKSEEVLGSWRKIRLRSLTRGSVNSQFARPSGIDTTVICPGTGGGGTLRSMFEKHAPNTYTIHLCKQGKEFQKILDFACLFRPIVGAVVGGKWKILGVTNTGPREAFVDVEEVSNKP